MKKTYTKILVLLFVVFALYIFSYVTQDVLKTEKEKKQFIVIGVDGVHVDEFKKALDQGLLPNIKKIISQNGTSTHAYITGHTITETAPGNAELHTGIPADSLGIKKNRCGMRIPEGYTVFEKLKQHNQDIKLGLIYGKNTCYLDESFFTYAHKIIDWWHNKNTYMPRTYVTDACSNSIDVAQKTEEFFKKYSRDSFYLFTYFGVPDCTGHTYGVPSMQYSDALRNVDEGVGIILEYITKYQLSPRIIITGDHGWNINSKGHSQATDDTRKIILITSDSSLIQSTYIKKQCDIAPTVLNYFDVSKDKYQESITAGCIGL